MIKTDLLIVVDMQNGFVNEKSQHAVSGVVKAIQRARASGVPVVFTRFINEDGSSWETLIGWSRLRKSPETDLHDEIAQLAEPHEVMDKTTYSSLVGVVQSIIDNGEVETVAVCGIATDGCVLKTAVDLFEAGIRPIVLTDAVASHAGDAVHEAGLLLIGRFIGGDQLIEIGEWLPAPVSA